MNPTFEDPEIERIKKEKITQMLEQAIQTKAGEKAIGRPITLTDDSFKSEVAKHKLIVVDFWAPWCGPCRMVGPLVEELAAEYAGKVAFGKMNVDENHAVAESFGVQGIPTLIVFKDGHPVDNLVGACAKSHIESRIKPHLEN